MTAPYLICDHLRLSDLLRMDTSAGTPPEAQAAAEAMAALRRSGDSLDKASATEERQRRLIHRTAGVSR